MHQIQRLLKSLLPSSIWLGTILLSTAHGGEAQGSERFSLSGVTHLNDTWRFSITDLKQKTSFWIALGQSLGDVKASDYNAQNGTLTLEINGAETKLSISKASEQPLPISKAITMAGYTEYTVPESPTGTPPPPPNRGTPPDTSPPEKVPEMPEFRKLREARSQP